MNAVAQSPKLWADFAARGLTDADEEPLFLARALVDEGAAAAAGRIPPYGGLEVYLDRRERTPGTLMLSIRCKYPQHDWRRLLYFRPDGATTIEQWPSLPNLWKMPDHSIARVTGMPFEDGRDLLAHALARKLIDRYTNPYRLKYDTEESIRQVAILDMTLACIGVPYATSLNPKLPLPECPLATDPMFTSAHAAGRCFASWVFPDGVEAATGYFLLKCPYCRGEVSPMSGARMAELMLRAGRDQAEIEQHQPIPSLTWQALRAWNSNPDTWPC